MKHITRPPPSSIQPLDESDFARLIELHLPLVHRIALRIKRRLPSEIEIEDLCSMGLIGLMSAVRKGDGAQAEKFAAYTAVRIRGAILDGLRATDWLPRATRARARELAATICRLEQQAGGRVDPSALGTELHMSRKELDRLLEEVKRPRVLSLNEPLHAEESCATLEEVIADHSVPTAYQMLERKELQALVAARICRLPERMRQILEMHFFQEIAHAEISARFGLTQSRISQIVHESVEILRAYLFGVFAADTW